MKLPELTLVDMKRSKPIFSGGRLCAVLRLALPRAEGGGEAFSSRFNAFYASVADLIEAEALSAAEGGAKCGAPLCVTVGYELSGEGGAFITVKRRLILRRGTVRLVREVCDAFDCKTGLLVGNGRKRQ